MPEVVEVVIGSRLAGGGVVEEGRGRVRVPKRVVMELDAIWDWVWICDCTSSCSCFRSCSSCKSWRARCVGGMGAWRSIGVNVTACCVVRIPDSSERTTSMTVILDGCDDILIGHFGMVNGQSGRRREEAAKTREDLHLVYLRPLMQAIRRAMDVMRGEQISVPRVTRRCTLDQSYTS